MARAGREAVIAEMRKDPNIFVIGEDIAKLGGVFGTTVGMAEEFGSQRVIDTPISETGFIGIASGAAIDLTLYDLKTGQPVPMTGRYDEMSRRSYSNYVGGTSRERFDRAVLRQAMEAQGFQVLDEEWWHFDYKDWAQYPIGNVSFEQLAR